MLQIINYSEKAVAVIGDTKEHKEQFKELGGRFNPKLSCGAGWIFSKRVEAALRAMVEVNGGSVEANPLDGARVYVGTYGKYAGGSIEGAWLDLKDYANKDEFLKACRELHKDERDPEFMFQDYEGVPSWMISESHIDAEVWQQKPEPEPKGGQSKAEIRAILEKAGVRDLDYHVKAAAAAVEVGGMCFVIKKPSIETHFCHDDDNDDEVREWYKATRTFEFFRSQNMKDLEHSIALLKEADTSNQYNHRRTVAYRLDSGIWQYDVNVDIEEAMWWLKNEELVNLDGEAVGKLLKAYARVQADFEKRLKTWWKKYGADKLHCWTYWKDA